MAGHGRYSRDHDWDPMRDDYNSSSHNTQNPDDDVGSSYQRDHTRLYITNIPPGLSEDGLRAAFRKFGEIKEAFVSRDAAKKYALVKYDTSSEASLAMMKMNRTEPMKLVISIAHKTKSKSEKQNEKDRCSMNGTREHTSREDSSSISSRSRGTRKQDNYINIDSKMMDELQVDDDLGLDEEIDSGLNLALEELKLQQLKLKEEQLACQHRMLLLRQVDKRAVHGAQGSNRRILPDGRIEVRNLNGQYFDSRDGDASYVAGAGDSNETTVCSCKQKKRSWNCEEEGSSTPSTCVLCSEDTETRKPDKSDVEHSGTTKCDCSKVTESMAKRSDVTSKKVNARMIASKSEMTNFKCSDLYEDSDDEDETNRLIQLRNADYMDIVEGELKLVVALAGYPKSKMRLQQMALFQKCLNDIIDMQLKAGLLKSVPCFIDYYLNRGALVCICKDFNTRDWVVRVSPGLQERMFTNLVLLKAKIKRLCLAVMKIPQSSWPATAQDAFKLLQYFNPTLKTNLWKIYAQKVVDDVETTSFVVDRISGEIIRGPTFKNVIDYDQIEFELTGFTEIYYESLIPSMEEDLHSVSSRVKLLEELRSGDPTPKNASQVSIRKDEMTDESGNKIENRDNTSSKLDKGIVEIECIRETSEENSQLDFKVAVEKENVAVQDVVVVDVDVKNELGNDNDDILAKLKDIEYIGAKEEILLWSEETNINDSQKTEKSDEICITDDSIGEKNADIVARSILNVSETSESVIGSVDTLLPGSSNLNIDSNRGLAYHRRTNYLDVENELKVAITLEGYPQNKLEGTHIKRLKHMFKDYWHKDMKYHRFQNLIIPKFQDVYLSNGAIIYICDSLETKDYLTEILPKFVHATDLKLMFRDMKDLVRYTRVVIKLPKDKAHVETMELLLNLKSKYPGLKPECWKYYSNVAGRQKRQFGFDPESLEIIKRPDFDPIFEGEKLTFKVINRQKRDVIFDVMENDVEVNVKAKEEVIKNMYAPVNLKIISNSLTRIRTNHYSDLIADDLKLYIGPTNYPETKIDETLFHTIKRTIENIVFESYQRGEHNDETIPKFHDMYLFDGVIFTICCNKIARTWLENAVPIVNTRIDIQLKATEYRGAVGIVSMVVQTTKNIDKVIDILQEKNPRLRTKYWRKISSVKLENKLDYVLQIDKLSAEVILDPKFDKLIDSKQVHFTLGHLKSLIKPRLALEKQIQKYNKKMEARLAENKIQGLTEVEQFAIKSPKVEYLDIGDNTSQQDSVRSDDINLANVKDDDSKLTVGNINQYYSHKPNKDIDPIIIEPEDDKSCTDLTIPQSCGVFTKVIIKIPHTVLPDNEDDLNIILDLLEDKNPGLNTEVWRVFTDDEFPKTGKVILYVDKQSLNIIKRADFDGTIGGEKMKFYF